MKCHFLKEKNQKNGLKNSKAVKPNEKIFWGRIFRNSSTPDFDSPSSFTSYLKAVAIHVSG
jgi:hypothetical protein